MLTNHAQVVGGKETVVGVEQVNGNGGPKVGQILFAVHLSGHSMAHVLADDIKLNCNFVYSII